MPSRSGYAMFSGQLARTTAFKAKTSVPPGGYVGTAGQTVANQGIFRAPPSLRQLGIGTSTRRRRRRKAKKVTTRRARRTARPARLVKGSAAAKRFMAKLRAKRRKKK